MTRIGESIFEITLARFESVADVAGRSHGTTRLEHARPQRAFVDMHRAWRKGIRHRRDYRELVVLNPDHVERFRRNLLPFGSDSDHRFTRKANPIDCEDWTVAYAMTKKRVEVDKISRRQDSNDPGKRFSSAGVNREDSRVRKRAA
jgi:hypothetical protein